MKLFDRLRSALSVSAPMNLPRIAALGAEAVDLGSLTEPGQLADLLRDGRATKAGVTVTEKLALRDSGVFRAASVICGSMGMLPIQMFARGDDGDSVKDRASPVYRLLHRRPNDWQTPFDFKSYMQGRALFEGAAYARIVRLGGKPTHLIPLQPFGRVEPILGDDFQVRYRFWPKKGGQVDIPARDMFSFRGPMSSDGVTGAKLLLVAAEAIGLANAAQTASARMFKNGAHLGGVLEHPSELSAEAIARLREQFEERYSGAENAGAWLVVEEGMKATALGGTAREAQTIEQRKHQIEELGRFTGVPRPLLMMDETSWGSGIEQLALFFVMYCLMPWFIAWEEAIRRDLIGEQDDDRLYARFNASALLRGSMKDQAEFFSKALGAGGAPGWMTPNEVRQLQEIARHEAGDKLNPGAAAKIGLNGGAAPDDKEPADG